MNTKRILKTLLLALLGFGSGFLTALLWFGQYSFFHTYIKCLPD